MTLCFVFKSLGFCSISYVFTNFCSCTSPWAWPCGEKGCKRGYIRMGYRFPCCTCNSCSRGISQSSESLSSVMWRVYLETINLVYNVEITCNIPVFALIVNLLHFEKYAVSTSQWWKCTVPISKKELFWIWFFLGPSCSSGQVKGCHYERAAENCKCCVHWVGLIYNST